MSSSNSSSSNKTKKNNRGRGKRQQNYQSLLQDNERLQGEIDAFKELESDRNSIKTQAEIEEKRRLVEVEDELIGNDSIITFKHARPEDKRDRKKLRKLIAKTEVEDRRTANLLKYYFLLILIVYLIYLCLRFGSNYLFYGGYSFIETVAKVLNEGTPEELIIVIPVFSPSRLFAFWLYWSFWFIFYFTIPIFHFYWYYVKPSTSPKVLYRTKYTIKGRNKLHINDDVRTDEQKRSGILHSNPLVRTVVIERYMRVTYSLKMLPWFKNYFPKAYRFVKKLPGLQSSSSRYTLHTSKRRISYELFVQLRKHSSMHVGLKMKTRMLKLNTHASYILGVNINRFNTDDLISNTVLVTAAYAKSAKFSVKNSGNFLFALSDDA